MIGWRITEDSLKGQLDSGGGPRHIYHSPRNISREGIWRYGTDGSFTIDPDRFIAGHNSELRRHLDSVPPKTPIRDVVDRCRVWESHADPAVRRVSKPSPDPIYLAYVVGDSDNISETTWVSPPESVGLEKMFNMVVSLGTTTTEAATSTATRPTGLERSCVFLMWEVGSCCDSVPELGRVFPFMLPGWWADKTLGGLLWCHPGWRRTVGGRKMATDPGGGVRLPGQW